MMTEDDVLRIDTIEFFRMTEEELIEKIKKKESLAGMIDPKTGLLKRGKGQLEDLLMESIIERAIAMKRTDASLLDEISVSFHYPCYMKIGQLNQETINSLNTPHEDYTEYKM